MYCVKCGVRLADGTESCPLCGTPVWNPEQLAPKERAYSERYPKKEHNIARIVASIASCLCAAAVIVVLIVCFALYGRLAWGGYAVLGTALFYVLFVLPIWFVRFHPIVFLPLDHAAILGFLLYVCAHTGGHWFLSFAFPVVGINGLLLTCLALLLRYVRGGRYYIFGGTFFLYGGYTMLIELFQHITFGSPMFRWSIYSAASLGAIGLFLILGASIPPLRRFLEKNFFI